MGRKLRRRDARPPCDGGDPGFSLIELLVVIAIVSTLAVGVTLTVGGPREQSDMARFRNVFETQQALAIAGRDMRGLKIGPKGVQVLAWRLGEAGGAWQEQGRPMAWRGRVAFSSPRPAAPGSPDIVFLPEGRNSAFSLGFAGQAAGCESDGWTGLTCG